MQIEILMHRWHVGLMIIQQSNPEAAIDTVLGRLALCSISITFSLLAVMFIVNRRRLRSLRKRGDGIIRTSNTEIQPPVGE